MLLYETVTLLALIALVKSAKRVRMTLDRNYDPNRVPVTIRPEVNKRSLLKELTMVSDEVTFEAFLDTDGCLWIQCVNDDGVQD